MNDSNDEARDATKLIILMDGSRKDFLDISKLMSDRKVIYVNTRKCDCEHEFEYIIQLIEEFSKSSSDIMVVNFSGREQIARDIGGERSEMIVHVSYNPSSSYYSEKTTDVFSELINVISR